MNPTVIPFPETEFAGWGSAFPGQRPWRLEGSLAAVLTLAPVIPIFPSRTTPARPPRRLGGGKAGR